MKCGPDEQWQVGKIPVSSSLATPACRMVAIEAIADRRPDGSYNVDHVLLPVLGIRTTIHDCYNKAVPKGTYVSEEQNHADMLDRRWYFQGREIDHEPMVLDADYGITPLSTLTESCNVACRVVACPWIADDDARMLAKDVEVARKDAIEKAREQDARWAAKAAEAEVKS